MYEKGSRKGTVRFVVKARPNARMAAVAGEFNLWKPLTMRRLKDGSFAATVAIKPGRYEYKFILDGDWVHDTDVPGVVMNRFGTFNSVAIID